MKQDNINYLPETIFKSLIQHTALVSVDLIVKNNDKVLLGKRRNKPAKNFWFTLGGRVFKNEKIEDAIYRIARVELGVELEVVPKFIGIFEHFYDDAIFSETSTHYVNIAYEVVMDIVNNLPLEQHDDYKWFSMEELIHSKEVHTYVKDYFLNSLGTVPQTRKSNI